MHSDEIPYCCEDMRRNVEHRCERHADPSDCPEALVGRFGNEFGIRVHDGGTSFVTIRFCPWCGSSVITPRERAMTDRFADLAEGETELVGGWTPADGRAVADETSERIAWLVEHRLKRIAATAGGWDVLFRDPRDGRLWEQTFPESGTHGGGPPVLRVLAPPLALSKYHTALDTR